MPATLIDSAIFRDIFSTAAMRDVFSDEQRVQNYLDIEAALARVQARLGIIPQEAAEEICRHCFADQIVEKEAPYTKPACASDQIDRHSNTSDKKTRPENGHTTPAAEGCLSLYPSFTMLKTAEHKFARVISHCITQVVAKDDGC